MAAASKKNLQIAESEAAFNNIVSNAGDKLVVVDFFAEWCGPCKMFAPIFESLAQQYPTVVFVKVDVDKVEEVTRRFGVRAMPTFHFLLNGASVASVRGADEKKVREAIETHKPLGGTTLSWGEPPAPATHGGKPHGSAPHGGKPHGSAPHGSAPHGSAAGEKAMEPFSRLSGDLRSKAEAIVSVTSCSTSAAAAMIQKHHGDVDAATMDVLTDPAAAEAFARAHLPSSTATASSSTSSASAIASLGHTAGELASGAAEPITGTGAALMFRMASKPAVSIKATFDPSVTVGAVALWLRSKLPTGATFTLCTRKGADEVALDHSRTLADEGLSPRGLVLLKDCAAPAFL